MAGSDGCVSPTEIAAGSGEGSLGFGRRVRTCFASSNALLTAVGPAELAGSLDAAAAGFSAAGPHALPGCVVEGAVAEFLAAVASVGGGAGSPPEDAAAGAGIAGAAAVAGAAGEAGGDVLAKEAGCGWGAGAAAVSDGAGGITAGVAAAGVGALGCAAIGGGLAGAIDAGGVVAGAEAWTVAPGP